MRPWLVSAAVFAFTATTWAQQLPANATREQLIDAAITAREQGNHILALNHAQRAGQMRMTATLRQFIAVELQDVGRAAEALEAARQCVAEAEADHALPHRRAVIRTCRQLVTTLENRAPAESFVRLIIPAPPPPDLRVTLDGSELPPERWSSPIRVPPGRVHVEVTATDRRTFVRDVTVAADGTIDVAVELSPAESFVRLIIPAPPPPGLRVTLDGSELPPERWSSPIRVPPGRVHVEVTATDRRAFVRDVTVVADGTVDVAVELPAARVIAVTSPAHSRLPNAGQWALAGTGVAMLAGATVTFVLEGNLREEQNTLCLNGDDGVRRCLSPRGNAIDDERAPLRIANNVLFFGGLAAVGGATLWYFLTRRASSERAPTTMSLQFAPSTTGIMFGLRGAL